MNLKDIKGNFKELYGGRIISNVIPVDEIECKYETIKNVKLLNEKYYNYTKVLKEEFNSLEELYEEIERCKDNPRIIFITNMRKLLKDVGRKEEYRILEKLTDMIQGTDIVLYMLFKTYYKDIEFVDDNGDTIYRFDKKLLDLIRKATGGYEHICHAVIYHSSYVTSMKRYYMPSFDIEFVYVTPKNITNDQYEKMIK